MSNDTEVASYHDVHVTTAKIERTSIFDLPFGYELTCTRTSGWRLWGPRRDGPSGLPVPDRSGPELIAGEYDKGLRIDVAGRVICDSLTKRQANA